MNVILGSGSTLITNISPMARFTTRREQRTVPPLFRALFFCFQTVEK